MTRLIVLPLPLIMLWLAFKEASEKEPAETGGNKAVVEVFEIGLKAEAWPTKEAGIEGMRMIAPFGEISSLNGEIQRGGMLSRLDRKERSSIVALIESKIDPELLVAFDEEELGKLRSYIDRLTSPAARDQPWLCWAPDVAAEKAAAYHEVERLTGLGGAGYALFANQFSSSGRWNRTAVSGFGSGNQGQPITLTWSIVPDGTSTPGVDEQANTSSDFRLWMAGIYGGVANGPAEDQPWFEIFEEAFQSMADTCGVTLEYEPSDDGSEISSFTLGSVGVRGDIRVSARALDGDSGTLALAFAPDHGDMIFDSSDGTFDLTSSSSIRLFNTIAHELGHGLGLSHVCPINRTKLLEPILTTSFRGPRFDEHQSLQRLYGDRFESHEEFNDNDSAAEATLVDLPLLETRSFGRLSIDDNTDVDFYRFEVESGQRLTARLTPGEGSYFEGAETNSGCSAGATFNSEAVHDLSLEILDLGGANVLALSTAGGVGEDEKIDLFKFPENGVYYLRVNGDASNGAQIYELTVTLNDRVPGPRLVAGDAVVIAESGSVKNSRLDPNETVRVSIPIENIGTLPTGNLLVNITGTTNVTTFSTDLSSGIEANSVGALDLVFGAVGGCGDAANFVIDIADESGSLLNFEREFSLGNRQLPVPVDEGFDDSSDLPSGWASEEIGGGLAWDSVSSRSVSSIRSAFTGGAGKVSSSSLISPSFVLTEGGGILSFEHFYRTEIGFDGAVLEVSRNDGAWIDLIESPDIIVSGGYDRVIRSGFDSPIAGRMAWSAKRSVFITTTVELPVEWAGESLQFRWRLVHDRSSSSEGWWLDNVNVTMVIEDCEVHRPALKLSLVGGRLDENFPSETVELLVSSELPLVTPLTVVLGAAGSASSEDFSGNLEVLLPAGQSQVGVSLSVRSDNLRESEEVLLLTIPNDQTGFAAGVDASETILIRDRTGLSEWLAGFFSVEVDLTGDSDGDGLSELAEYLLGTDPTERGSKRNLSLTKQGSRFLLPLVGLPERSDAVIGVEFSTDLRNWEKRDLEVTGEGLLVEPSEGKTYFRLTFSVLP